MLRSEIIQAELPSVLVVINDLLTKYPWMADIVEGRPTTIPRPTWKGYMGFHEAYEKGVRV